MSKVRRLSEIQEFSRAGSIPDDAITPLILENVSTLGEREHLEPILRQILHTPGDTPHGPTEIADIITTKVSLNGVPTTTAFVLKGRGAKKITSRIIAHQFLKLRGLNSLGLIVLLTLGDVHDDAQKDFITTASDLGCDYIFIDRHDVSKLFIAYKFICPRDGLVFVDGKCSNGHETDSELTLNYAVREKPLYEILSIEDDSHGSARRLAAKVIADPHYNNDTLREIIKIVTDRLKGETFSRNDNVRSHWGDTPAHIIWVYIAGDHFDLANVNWICSAMWTSPELDPSYTPQWSATETIPNNIGIRWNDSYFETKEIYRSSEVSKGEYVELAENLANGLFNIQNAVINELFQYLEGKVTDEHVKSFLQTQTSSFDVIQEKADDLPQPPVECNNYSELLHAMVAALGNIFLVCRDDLPNKWNLEQRRDLILRNLDTLTADRIKWNHEREKIGLSGKL